MYYCLYIIFYDLGKKYKLMYRFIIIFFKMIELKIKKIYKIRKISR